VKHQKFKEGTMYQIELVCVCCLSEQLLQLYRREIKLVLMK